MGQRDSGGDATVGGEKKGRKVVPGALVAAGDSVEIFNGNPIKCSGARKDLPDLLPSS